MLVGSFSGTLPVATAAPSTVSVSSATLPTNFGDTVFVVGVYSPDSGSTWNGMEAETAHPGNLGTLTVYAQSRADDIQIIARNSRASGAGSNAPTYNVLYKVMMIAKPDQGIIQPLPIGSNVYFDSRKNYQKIALDDIRTISGTNTTTTIPHGLGYIPRIRVFYETGGALRQRGAVSESVVWLDTSNVYIYTAGTVSGYKLYTRVYHEA